MKDSQIGFRNLWQSGQLFFLPAPRCVLHPFAGTAILRDFERASPADLIGRSIGSFGYLGIDNSAILIFGRDHCPRFAGSTTHLEKTTVVFAHGTLRFQGLDLRQTLFQPGLDRPNILSSNQ